MDSARGEGSEGLKKIYANEGDAEDSSFYDSSNKITLDGNGVKMWSNGHVNTDGDKFVLWGWDAGTAAATPSTDGNITISNQWVNATAGFSISKYTMGADGGTFGHALGAKPDFVMVKRLAAASWGCWHKNIPNTGYLMLNDDDGVSTWNLWGDTDPTNNIVTVSGDSYTGNNGDTYVAYCWTAIPNYSSFGTYAGSGSGVAWVHTGFKPKYLLVKCTNTSTNWKIYDSVRDPNGNTMTYELETDTHDAEVTTADGIDFNANGFMIRGNSGGALNGGGNTYIYAAFADYPQKIARAQ